MMITIEKEAWERGIRDGFAGRKESPVRLDEIDREKWEKDLYSYSSGWIEGDAARQGHEVTVDVARLCGLLPGLEKADD